MSRVYRIVLTLCVIALLTGIAFGNSTNDTGNATKNNGTDKNVTNTTGPVTKNTANVTSAPTVVGTTAKVTETTTKPTTAAPTTIKPTAPKETPKETPGFGMVAAIGIISVVYIFGKKRR